LEVLCDNKDESCVDVAHKNRLIWACVHNFVWQLKTVSKLVVGQEKVLHFWKQVESHNVLSFLFQATYEEDGI
jgi:hypothetical protein